MFGTLKKIPCRSVELDVMDLYGSSLKIVKGSCLQNEVFAVAVAA